MSDDRLPPYAAAIPPDEQEIGDYARAMADHVHALMDKYGVDERQRSDVLEYLSSLFTWSDGEPED